MDDQAFINAYIEAIYFTNVGPDDDIPSDSDFAPETLESIKADCAKFLALYGAYIEASGADITQAGHDFWLTRCGHGTGFWDRPEIYGRALADKLTEAVGWRTQFPNIDCYLGDDGFVYF